MLVTGTTIRGTLAFPFVKPAGLTVGRWTGSVRP